MEGRRSNGGLGGEGAAREGRVEVEHLAISSKVALVACQRHDLPADAR